MNSNQKTIYEWGYGKPIIVKGAKSHINDPYFVEKLERAKKTLKNAVFPVSR
jgi:hypothetical protein